MIQTTPGIRPAATPTLLQNQSANSRDFTRELSVADKQQHKLREAAEQLVSAAFVVPLLSELRDQPFDTDMFGGGFEQDAFRSQMDTILADRMVKSANWPIVDRITQHIGGATYRNTHTVGDAA